MAIEGLHPSQIEGLLGTWSEDPRSLAREARPRAGARAALLETVAFRSLSCFKPDIPYWSIGGSLCLESVQREKLVLGFLHGAFLLDPEHLLRGKAEAKRTPPITDSTALHRPAVADLILAALAQDPIA